MNFIISEIIENVGHTILLFTSNFYKQPVACFSALFHQMLNQSPVKPNLMTCKTFATIKSNESRMNAWGIDFYHADEYTQLNVTYVNVSLDNNAKIAIYGRRHVNVTEQFTLTSRVNALERFHNWILLTSIRTASFQIFHDLGYYVLWSYTLLKWDRNQYC